MLLCLFHKVLYGYCRFFQQIDVVVDGDKDEFIGKQKGTVEKSLWLHHLEKSSLYIPCRAISSSIVLNKSSTCGDFGGRLGALTYHHLADGDDQMRC